MWQRRLGALIVLVWVGALAQVSGFVPYFVQDTMAGTAGTNLTARTGETGATWTLVGGYNGAIVLSDEGRARSNSNQASTAGGAGAVYEASGTPPSAEYDLIADFHFKTTIAGEYYDIIARGSGSGNSGYRLEYDTGNTGFIFNDDGGLLTYASYPAANGTTVRATLRIMNGFKRFYLDGIPQGDIITSNSITGAGKVRISMATPTASTNSAGIHIDNVMALPIVRKPRTLFGIGR